MDVKKNQTYLHKKLGMVVVCTHVDDSKNAGDPTASINDRVAWFQFVLPPQRTPEYVLDFSIPESLWANRLSKIPEDEDSA